MQPFDTNKYLAKAAFTLLDRPRVGPVPSNPVECDLWPRGPSDWTAFRSRPKD
jgi:hypothetical protein